MSPREVTFTGAPLDDINIIINIDDRFQISKKYSKAYNLHYSNLQKEIIGNIENINYNLTLTVFVSYRLWIRALA